MMEAIPLLRDLMRCRPVSADVPAVNRAVNLLAGVLQGAGLYTTVEDVGGRAVLYAAAEPGEKRPAILLNAHLDVVPAADPALFELREDPETGRLYGRGASDCLGNCVVAARTLARIRGNASVGAIFSTDEEIGGATTAAMVERGYGARSLVLVMDGGGYAVAVGQKGILSVRLRARGVACHSAEPWKGENALDRLILGYLKVREVFPEVQPPDTWKNTMAATMLRAGTASNRVPDTAEMTLNIRFTEHTAPEELLEEIERVSALEVEQNMTCPPVFVPPDTPVVKALRACMERVLQREIPVRRLNGATDARHFTGLHVPVAIVGIPGDDCHGRHEYAEKAGLRAYEDMLCEFLPEAEFAGEE